MVSNSQVSREFYNQHDTYATFLIAPSVEDSKKITARITNDNFDHSEHILMHKYDPGRATDVDWFKVRIGFHDYLSTH